MTYSSVREEKNVTAFVITRIQTGDYDRWRPMFDQDQPGAREKAQVAGHSATSQNGS